MSMFCQVVAGVLSYMSCGNLCQNRSFKQPKFPPPAVPRQAVISLDSKT